MIEIGREKREIIEDMCRDSKEVLVLGAAEGKTGRVWAPELNKPSFCMIRQGDFTYLMGLPPKGEKSLDLRLQLLDSSSHDYITPSDERWEEWMDENFFGECRVMSRYSMRRGDGALDMEKLEQYAGALPGGINLKKIDKRLFRDVQREGWSKDFCSNFESPEAFLENGLGVVAVEGRKIVSGCSAYGFCNGMLEIEIGTRSEYRRRGLALACGASFILICMDRGIYPNWDAANLKSVALAEKLGYTLDREYSVYQLSGEEIAC